MASLAEHFSLPLAEVAPVDPISIAATLPVGLFCVSLALFAFSCSVLAFGRIKPREAD